MQIHLGRALYFMLVKQVIFDCRVPPEAKFISEQKASFPLDIH